MICQVRPIRTAASSTKWSSSCEVGLLPIFEKNEELNMSLGGKGGAGLGSSFDGGISVRIWQVYMAIYHSIDSPYRFADESLVRHRNGSSDPADWGILDAVFFTSG